ncbi:MAG: L-histidine N(alpha)-methyltransferase, partial [Terriglobales bacterium]
MATEVFQGLIRPGQKTLPSKYLYDEVGTRLFEAICALPEYGLTAADGRLLQAHAAHMLSPFGRDLTVVELGSGSGQKTRFLLEELARSQTVRYSPIEISASALARCQAELGDISGLDFRPIHAEYLDGLAQMAQQRRGPVLLLFLGSTLGNFDPGPAREFLRKVRRFLLPGDGLLLGLDLVKPIPTLLQAYDDPAGVTAAFNLNLLSRLNRELDADFDLRHWRHQIVYRARYRRIEMH